MFSFSRLTTCDITIISERSDCCCFTFYFIAGLPSGHASGLINEHGSEKLPNKTPRWQRSVKEMLSRVFRWFNCRSFMKLVNNSSLVLRFCWLAARRCLQRQTKSVLLDAYRNEARVPKPEIVTIAALSCRFRSRDGSRRAGVRFRRFLLIACWSWRAQFPNQ